MEIKDKIKNILERVVESIHSKDKSEISFDDIAMLDKIAAITNKLALSETEKKEEDVNLDELLKKATKKIRKG